VRTPGNVLKHCVTRRNPPQPAGHRGETRRANHIDIDHDHCLIRFAMLSRPVLLLCLAASASLGPLLAGMGLASAQQTPLDKGALYESSRQVAADQARQTESGIAGFLRQAQPVAPTGIAPVLRELQGARRGHGTQDSPFGTGYERRMERAAAAGLSNGSPSRPAAADAAAGAGGRTRQWAWSTLIPHHFKEFIMKQRTSLRALIAVAAMTAAGSVFAAGMGGGGMGGGGMGGGMGGMGGMPVGAGTGTGQMQQQHQYQHQNRNMHQNGGQAAGQGAGQGQKLQQRDRVQDPSLHPTTPTAPVAPAN
jgi:hypothetical protein